MSCCLVLLSNFTSSGSIVFGCGTISLNTSCANSPIHMRLFRTHKHCEHRLGPTTVVICNISNTKHVLVVMLSVTITGHLPLSQSAVYCARVDDNLRAC